MRKKLGTTGTTVLFQYIAFTKQIRAWMNKLHISDDARQDLVEIKQYIAEDLDSPNAAAQTVKGILKGISRLKEQSRIGAPLSSIVPVESEYRFLV